MTSLHFLLFKPLIGKRSFLNWLAVRLRIAFRTLIKSKEKQKVYVSIRKVAPMQMFNQNKTELDNRPIEITERLQERTRTIRRRTKRKSMMFDFEESVEGNDGQKQNVTNDSDIFDKLSEDISDFEEEMQEEIETPKIRKK